MTENGRDDFVELSGEALLDFFTSGPVAVCGRCRRQTTAATAFGAEDRMTQPDGYPCGGRFSDPRRSP